MLITKQGKTYKISDFIIENNLQRTQVVLFEFSEVLIDIRTVLSNMLISYYNSYPGVINDSNVNFNEIINDQCIYILHNLILTVAGISSTNNNIGSKGVSIFQIDYLEDLCSAVFYNLSITNELDSEHVSFRNALSYIETTIIDKLNKDYPITTNDNIIIRDYAFINNSDVVIFFDTMG